MRRVYYASRIASSMPVAATLAVPPNLHVEQLIKLYTEKEVILGNHIYNGPWILRHPSNIDSGLIVPLPKALTPFDVWQMVKNKILSSDIVFGLVHPKAYGTIAELSYAASIRSMAVYALPELQMDDADIKDLWFVYQVLQETRMKWKDEDFRLIESFRNYGITSIQDYDHYIKSIKPKFMSL